MTARETADRLAEMTGGFDLRRDAIEAALDAAAGVKVKPLEWVKPPEANTLTRAETIVGNYTVWTHPEAGGRWFATLRNLKWESWSYDAYDEASCHAAAQADYEKRILSALVLGDAAALDAAYRRGVEDAARVVLNYGCGAHDCPVGANILAISPGDGWLPIETAPRDGTRVLLFARGPHGPMDTYFGVGQWANADPDLSWTVAGWFWEFAIRPTKWRPLPSPPTEQKD